jgi:protein-L-isoaspartate(D-aspartate) O-methyltransferase
VQIIKKTKLLEIGTGSGYQASVLSNFFSEVYTVEIIPKLAEGARTVLARLGYTNVFVKEGSGEWGWNDKSPFDAIIVTAGMKKVPQELFDQLKVGGILIAPVGEGKEKTMTRFTKRELGTKEMKREEFGTFSFVPFVQGSRRNKNPDVRSYSTSEVESF